jgi:uncharacterized protein DUF6798
MAESPQNPRAGPLGQGEWSATDLSMLALLTVFAMLVMGYHPGLEDDAFYLAAIKRNLNPALFPHDSEFFRLQFQATIFDKLIAFSVRISHLPLAWTVLLWQFAAIFLLLHGCWRINRRCFAQPAAQWAAVTTIAILLTLPLPGIAMTITDQYLHPRTLATAAIVAAIVEVLDRRLWLAGVLLAIAFAVHALMAAFGISFCVFLFWRLRALEARRPSPTPVAAALLLPLGWVFPLGWVVEPASDAWRQAAATRSFYFVGRWHWYEWLGVFAPLVLAYFFRWLVDLLPTSSVDEVCSADCAHPPRTLRFKASDRSDRKEHPRRSQSEGHDRSELENGTLIPVLSALLYYGVFQTAVGLLVMLPPGLERLRPFEPMRYLHLLYLLFFLMVGGLLGRYVLDRKIYRWLLLFLPVSAGMFYAQRQMYPASAHLELLGVAPQNAWLQAFAWIRQNTPVDSLFAIDPHYVTLPGEDYHGFRALAERSVLADYEKDGGMAARVPRLAPRWLKEVNAQSGWQNFKPADFQFLKNEFGVTWVILSRRDAARADAEKDQAGLAMTCPFQNDQLQVCRLY